MKTDVEDQPESGVTVTGGQLNNMNTKKCNHKKYQTIAHNLDTFLVF